MKTSPKHTVKYRVRMALDHTTQFSSWKKAVDFAKLTGKTMVTAFCGDVEMVYELDTWKTPKQIEFDILCEL